MDARIVVGIALSGLFCLFTSTMTITSARFIFTNITNIDLFKKNQVFRIAVRVANNTRPTHRFQIVEYPLSPVVSSSTTFSRGQLDSVCRSRTPSPGPGRPRSQGPWTSSTGPWTSSQLPRMPSQLPWMPSTGPWMPSTGPWMCCRDEQARRTFAILTTEPGENPWDLGYWRNFKSVMGNNIFEWLLPLRHSPCCNHDSMISDYEYGPLIEELMRRYEITDSGPAKDGYEMTMN